MTDDAEPAATTTISITLTVHAYDVGTAARVVEALGRPLVGFAADGLYTNLTAIKLDEEE